MLKTLNNIKSKINKLFSKTNSQSSGSSSLNTLENVESFSDEQDRNRLLPSGDCEKIQSQKKSLIRQNQSQSNVANMSRPKTKKSSKADNCLFKSGKNPQNSSKTNSISNKSVKRSTARNDSKSLTKSKRNVRSDGLNKMSYGLSLQKRSCKLDTTKKRLRVKRKKRKAMKTVDLQKHLAEMHLKSHAVCAPDWTRPLAFDLDNAFILNELLNEIENRMRLRTEERHRYFSNEMRHKLISSQPHESMVMHKSPLPCNHEATNMDHCNTHGNINTQKLSDQSTHCHHRHRNNHHRHKKHHHENHHHHHHHHLRHRHLVSPPSVIDPTTNIEITEGGIKARGYPELDVNKLVDPSFIHSSDSYFSSNSYYMDF